MRITFLGTAANGGVPQLDCTCINCVSGVVRKRSCLLIQEENENLILDCGPDFKQQMEGAHLKLQKLNGIALTHLHWDHSHGLIELAGGKQVNVSVIVHKKLQKVLQTHQDLEYLFRIGFAQFHNRLKKVQIDFIEVSHDPNFSTFAIKVTSKKKSIIYVPDIAKFNKKLLYAIKNSNLTVFDSTFLEEDKYNHMAVKNSAPILKECDATVIYSHINHSENPEVVKSYIHSFGFKLAEDNLSIEI